MKVQLKPLGEQVLVIAGASSGIGLVTARRAARRGGSAATLRPMITAGLVGAAVACGMVAVRRGR